MAGRLLLIALLFGSGLCGCAPVNPWRSWNPNVAISDAEHDIAVGKIRFCYVGGPASHAPGLPAGSASIVSRYPHRKLGLQSRSRGRHYEERLEYASRYNAWMWGYVSNERR